MDLLGGVLQERFGFEVEKLVGTQATRQGILDALDRLSQTSAPNDAVFLFFAGHGYFDEGRQQGYWLPADATRDSRATWISNADLVDTLRALPARHVLLVSDACFSGSMLGLRDLAVAEPPRDQQAAMRLAEKRSRWVVTSGGNEPVVDAYLNSSHSVFAWFFTQVLNEQPQVFVNPGAYLDTLQKRVLNNAPQQPQMSPIREAGDEGGQFVMINREGAPLPQEVVPVDLLLAPHPKPWALVGCAGGALVASGLAAGAGALAYHRFTHPEDNPEMDPDAMARFANGAAAVAGGAGVVALGLGVAAVIRW